MATTKPLKQNIRKRGTLPVCGLVLFFLFCLHQLRLKRLRFWGVASHLESLGRGRDDEWNIVEPASSTTGVATLISAPAPRTPGGRANAR